MEVDLFLNGFRLFSFHSFFDLSVDKKINHFKNKSKLNNNPETYICEDTKQHRHYDDKYLSDLFLRVKA